MVSKEVIPEIKSADSVGSHSATSEGLNTNRPHDSITSAQDGANLSNMESERCPPRKSHMLKSKSHSSGSKSHKLPKSTVEVSRDQTCSETENTGQIADELGRFQGNISILILFF